MKGVPDRWWWVLIIVGLAFALETLVILIWSLLGFFVSIPLSSYDNGVFLLFALLLLILPVGFLTKGLFAHQRFRLRSRALSGDQEAMAKADIPVNSTVIGELTREPLELHWRDAGGEFAPLIEGLLGVLIVVGLILFIPFALSVLFITSPDTGAPPIWFKAIWMPETGRIILWFIIALFIASLFCFLMLFFFWTFWAKTCRVIAYPNGLHYFPSIGRSQLLRWSDVRLWEIALEGQVRIYRVYGPQLRLEWRDPPAPPLIWLSLKEHFAERQQALINLIAQRTSLVPRTLQKELMVKEAHSQQTTQ